ncbi:MAG: MFS transporter [Chloroflexi bacterium]|nr:MFS transporter [Chloroflexota bacterium]
MEAQPFTPKRSPLRRIGRNVYLMGLVSLFADVSGDLVYPIVPLFLTLTLGAPMVVVGLVEGIADGSSNVFKVISGWLSDHTRSRRPFINLGYGIAALSKLMLALAAHWGVVAVSRAADRMGKGIRGAPRDALISQSVDPDIRGAAFGLHRAMDTAGGLIGSLLAFFLVTMFTNNLRLAFAVAVFPAFLAFLLTFAVREAQPTEAQTQDPGKSKPSWRRLPRQYWLVVVVMMAFSLANSSDAFILLRFKNLGLGVGAVILTYVVFNAVYAALAYRMGALSDRVGRRRLILAAFALYAFTYLGLAVAPGSWAVWPLLAVYGAYLSIGEGVGQALIADCTPTALRATGMGLYQGAYGVGVLLASLAAGTLWDSFGPSTPFLLGSGLAALAFVLGTRYLPDSRAFVK